MSKILVETKNPVWDSQKLVVYITDAAITVRRLIQTEPEESFSGAYISLDQLLSHDSLANLADKIHFKENELEYRLSTESIFQKESLDLFWKTGNVLFLNIKKPIVNAKYVSSGYIQSVLDETHFNHLTAHQWSELSYKKKLHNDLLWLYPLEGQSISECSLIIRIGSRESLITNMVIDKYVSFSEIDALNNQMLLSATITGPDSIPAEGSAEFSVSLERNGKILAIDHTLEVEPVNGYAPNKRCILTQGTGTFTVTALGLFPGSTLRVKLNNRAFTSIAEKTISVTN